MPGFNWTLPSSRTLLSIQLSQIVTLGNHRWAWCPPDSPPLLLTISRKFLLLWFLGFTVITTLFLPHYYHLSHSWLCPLIIYRLWQLAHNPFSVISPTINLGTSSSPWILDPTSWLLFIFLTPLLFQRPTLPFHLLWTPPGVAIPSNYTTFRKVFLSSSTLLPSLSSYLLLTGSSISHIKNKQKPLLTCHFSSDSSNTLSLYPLSKSNFKRTSMYPVSTRHSNLVSSLHCLPNASMSLNLVGISEFLFYWMLLTTSPFLNHSVLFFWDILPFYFPSSSISPTLSFQTSHPPISRP